MSWSLRKRKLHKSFQPRPQLPSQAPEEVPSPASTLVLLAAGLGSRFGGDKQYATLGPAGETLMDYAVFDAARAGISRIVLIVRPEAAPLVAALRQRYGNTVQVDAVVQRLELLPPDVVAPAGRTRPWGTTHAVLTAGGIVTEPFIVINADDFYGAEAYQALVIAMSAPAAGVDWHLAGFPIAETLSPSGPVNRAICRVASGMLQGLDEVKGLAADAEGTIRGAAGTPVQADATVSMNMWGFTPAAFDTFADGFSDFLAHADLMSDEYYLPDAVARAMARGQQVRVIGVPAEWCGVTYASDAPVVREYLARLVAQGDYPSPLWP